MNDAEKRKVWCLKFMVTACKEMGSRLSVLPIIVEKLETGSVSMLFWNATLLRINTVLGVISFTELGARSVDDR